MTAAVHGAALGLLFGTGLLLVAGGVPPARPITLDERLAPYLRDAPRPSRLINPRPVDSSALLTTVRSLVRPRLLRAARQIEQVIGGHASVQRRLDALASSQTVEQFRVAQVEGAAAGVAGGVVVTAVIAVGTGSVDVVSALLLCLVGAGGGVLFRDWSLTARVARRRQTMLAEFPVVAELLALAVTAGEAPMAAIERICRLTGGEVARELRGVLGLVRSGTPLLRALEQMRDRTGLDQLSRFVDGLVVAIERGTPLADVLRAQAADVRQASRRALLEAGGRKEIEMMVPVVFLLLPLTVLFALYPGLVTITQVAR